MTSDARTAWLGGLGILVMLSSWCLAFILWWFGFDIRWASFLALPGVILFSLAAYRSMRQ